MDLAYDGTDFAGWQAQPGLRTVQGVVEEALSRVLGGVGVRVRGAGRTDRGVHARGQVADAWLPSPLEDRRLLRALGALLPRDVRPLGVVSVEEGFHARRDAASKTYAYWLDRTPYGDPFLRRFAHHEPARLDLEAIREALAMLPGRRDFSAFAGAASEVEDRVRTLIEARLDVEGPDLWVFRFTADGFLNRMVRNLVGTLLEIGRGRIPPARIADILASKDRRQAGPTAPACGLVLEKVSYPSPDKPDPPLAADRSAGWCRMAPFRSRGAP
jgi:tRNA pseudouridine38-40 synthase